MTTKACLAEVSFENAGERQTQLEASAYSSSVPSCTAFIWNDLVKNF